MAAPAFNCTQGEKASSSWNTAGQLMLLGSGGLVSALARLRYPPLALVGLGLTGLSVGGVVGMGGRHPKIRRICPHLLALLGGALVGIGAVDAFRGCQLVRRATRLVGPEEVLRTLLLGVEEMGWGVGILGSAAKATLLFAAALQGEAEWAVDKEKQIQDLVAVLVSRESEGKERDVSALWRRLTLVFSSRTGEDEILCFLRDEYCSMPVHLLEDPESYRLSEAQNRKERLESAMACLTERQLARVIREPSLQGVSASWLVERLTAHEKELAVEVAVESCCGGIFDLDLEDFLSDLQEVERACADEGVASQKDEIHELVEVRFAFETAMRGIEPFAAMLSRIDEEPVLSEARGPAAVTAGLEQLAAHHEAVSGPTLRLREAYVLARRWRRRLSTDEAFDRLERLSSLADSIEEEVAEDAEDAFRAFYSWGDRPEEITDMLVESLSVSGSEEIEGRLCALGLYTVDDLVEAGVIHTREGSKASAAMRWEKATLEEKRCQAGAALKAVVAERAELIEEDERCADPRSESQLSSAYHLVSEGLFYTVAAAVLVRWVASAPRIFGIGIAVGVLPALLLASRADPGGLASRDITQLGIDRSLDLIDGRAVRFGKADPLEKGKQLFFACVVSSLALLLLRQFGVWLLGASIGGACAFSVANWSRRQSTCKMGDEAIVQNFLNFVRV